MMYKYNRKCSIQHVIVMEGKNILSQQWQSNYIGFNFSQALKIGQERGMSPIRCLTDFRQIFAECFIFLSGCQLDTCTPFRLKCFVEPMTFHAQIGIALTI